jgi:hypothetical protein
MEVQMRSGNELQNDDKMEEDDGRRCSGRSSGGMKRSAG